MKKINDIFVGLSIKIVVYISMAILSFIALSSIICTAYFDQSYIEYINYNYDSILLNLFIIAMYCLIVFFIFNSGLFKKINSKYLILICLAICFVFGITWVILSRSKPVFDQKYVARIANQVIYGDYSAMQYCNYAYANPHQLGIITLYAFLFYLCGIDNFIFIQFINVLALTLSYYYLIKFTQLLFDKQTTNLTILLLCLCIAPMFFTTFVYANIIGLFFMIFSTYHLINYCISNNKLSLLLSVLSIIIATILKNNYAIFMVSNIIVLILKTIKEYKILPIVGTSLIIITYAFLNNGIINYYENKLNTKINNGMPLSLYLAMGLQESYIAPGWYNGYNSDTYHAVMCNAKNASKIAKQNISNRITTFANDPIYTFKFFLTKNVSQWTEPTFESLLISNYDNRHTGPISSFTYDLYYGKANTIVVNCMTIYHMIVFCFSLMYIIINRNKMNYYNIVFFIALIGGFIFHSFMEAKSQYLIQYLIILIPYCASASIDITKMIKAKFKL